MTLLLFQNILELQKKPAMLFVVLYLLMQVKLKRMSSVNISKVSSKPWHLTFSPEEKQMYIWKGGSRMKLVDQSSSGPVISASFLNADVVNISIISQYS